MKRRAVLGDDAAQPRFVETLPRLATVHRHARAQRAACSPPAPLPRPRLVVLPFMNLTGDPSHDYFIDGFTEELIAQLGHCATALASWPAPRRCSTRMLVARDIGEALRVDYLVEGSVRVGGDRGASPRS